MTRPDLVFRLAILVCVGCVLPAVMSGCGEAAPLDDSDASMAVAAPRSPESRGSAILELLRDAGGPELARTAALRDAAERMEREAPTEWGAFLMAAEGFSDAAPVVDWTFFLWLFMTAAAEAPITEAEHEAMNAAYEELKAEMDKAEFATKNAVERSNAAAEEARVALQAALEVASEAGLTGVPKERWAEEGGRMGGVAQRRVEEAERWVEEATRWSEEGNQAAARGMAVAVRRLMVALVLEGKPDEALAIRAQTMATEYPSEYAAFVAAVEAVEAKAPDAWAEFVRVGALAILAPTEAWR